MFRPKTAQRSADKCSRPLSASTRLLMFKSVSRPQSFSRPMDVAARLLKPKTMSCPNSAQRFPDTLSAPLSASTLLPEFKSTSRPASTRSRTLPVAPCLLRHPHRGCSINLNILGEELSVDPAVATLRFLRDFRIPATRSCCQRERTRSKSDLKSSRTSRTSVAIRLHCCVAFLRCCERL